jgi:hypothetical protein
MTSNNNLCSEKIGRIQMAAKEEVVKNDPNAFLQVCWQSRLHFFKI